MRTLAILPIKSFTAAKQRLSGALATESRETLAEAMFADVLATLREVPGIAGLVVVTGNEVAAASARRAAASVIDDAEESGQSPAALLGVGHALAAGYDRVLLVPGDAPLIDGDEVTGMLDRAGAARTAVTIVPDRHREGTNALLLRPPTAIEPSFGPGSLARHVAAARVGGLSHQVEELRGLMLDIDTPDDLAALSAALDASEDRAPHTRAAIERVF